MSISNLKARAGGGQRRGNSAPRTFHMFGQVVGYHLEDKTGMKSNPDKDTMTIALFRDAHGLKAVQAEDGTLETQVTISLEKAEKKAGSAYEPLSIRDMKKGRGSAKATNPGDFVLFKDVKKVGDAFVARRIEAGVRSFNPENHAPFSGMFSVRKERYQDVQQDGQAERIFTQYRVGALTDAAVAVHTPEAIRAEAIAAMEYADQMHGAEPQAILRVIVTNKDGDFVESASVEVSKKWDKDARAHLTIEDSVDAFLAGEDGQAWIGHIGNAFDGVDAEGVAVQKADEDGNFMQFDVIPQFRVRTGRASMPNARKQDKEANNRSYNERDVDDRVDYLRHDDEKNLVSGYVASDVILNRVKNDDGSFSRTHTIFTQHQRQYLPRMAQAELITPTLSEKLVKTFEQRGDDAAREAVMANKASTAPAETPAAEDEPGMTGMQP